jgi:hypothetical protein
MSKSQIEREIETLVGKETKPSTNREIAGFDTWNDVLDAARRGDRLMYQGAMDRFPHTIHVIKIFKNGSLRIDPLSNQTDKFTADPKYLRLFRRRV